MRRLRVRFRLLGRGRGRRGLVVGRRRGEKGSWFAIAFGDLRVFVYMAVDVCFLEQRSERAM